MSRWIYIGADSGLGGHELGQMAGVNVIKPRKTIFKAEIESEAQQDNDETMLCKL